MSACIRCKHDIEPLERYISFQPYLKTHSLKSTVIDQLYLILTWESKDKKCGSCAHFLNDDIQSRDEESSRKRDQQPSRSKNCISRWACIVNGIQQILIRWSEHIHKLSNPITNLWSISYAVKLKAVKNFASVFKLSWLLLDWEFWFEKALCYIGFPAYSVTCPIQHFPKKNKMLWHVDLNFNPNFHHVTWFPTITWLRRQSQFPKLKAGTLKVFETNHGMTEYSYHQPRCNASISYIVQKMLNFMDFLQPRYIWLASRLQIVKFWLSINSLPPEQETWLLISI